MPSVQQQNKPTQYEINQATLSYRTILTERRATAETDKIFSARGVDVEKEKYRFGIKPYQKVEVSDALAAKIEAKKSELKASWAEQDKKDGPPYESMVLAREKKLLKEFYVQGETEEAYYKRQHDIKDLDERIKQAQATQANNDPKVVEWRTKFNQSRETAIRVQAEADSRRVVGQSVNNGSNNVAWNEARARNNAVRDRQIANISESTRPARDFVNESLANSNFQPGVGIDLSHAPDMARAREYAITNPSMSSRFSMSSTTSQYLVQGEADVAAGRAYKQSKWGELPKYSHINTPEEILAKHRPAIDRTTTLINESLRTDPTGEALSRMNVELHYADNTGTVHISRNPRVIIGKMLKDDPNNRAYEIAKDHLDGLQSDKIHLHAVNARGKLLDELGYKGDPNKVSLAVSKELIADTNKINRYLRGDRFSPKDKRAVANICIQYGLSLSDLDSCRNNRATDRAIEIKGNMLARVIGNGTSEGPLTPKTITETYGSVERSNQEASQATPAQVARLGQPVFTSFSPESTKKDVTKQDISNANISASTVSPEALAQFGAGLSYLVKNGLNDLRLPPVPKTIKPLEIPTQNSEYQTVSLQTKTQMPASRSDFYAKFAEMYDSKTDTIPSVNNLDFSLCKNDLQGMRDFMEKNMAQGSPDKAHKAFCKFLDQAIASEASYT